MNFLSVLFFAVLANFDNLVIGISYGIKKIRISPVSYFLIAAITFIGTALSMLFGKKIAHFVPIAAANAIGGVIIIVIGLVSLVKYLHSKRLNRAEEIPWPIENPEKYDKNRNNKIEYNETISLGLALAVNNMGLGVGASVSGLSVLPAAATSFFFSIVFMLAGNFFGNQFSSKFIGKYAELIGAVGIIALGIWEILF